MSKTKRARRKPRMDSLAESCRALQRRQPRCTSHVLALAKDTDGEDSIPRGFTLAVGLGAACTDYAEREEVEPTVRQWLVTCRIFGGGKMERRESAPSASQARKQAVFSLERLYSVLVLDVSSVLPLTLPSDDDSSLYEAHHEGLVSTERDREPMRLSVAFGKVCTGDARQRLRSRDQPA